MSLPYARVEAGFSGPTAGDYYTVGDPIRGQVGLYPVAPEDVWVDISKYVRSWSVRSGATQANTPTLRYPAGTATIVLNDGDRRFDPDNLAGPYVAAGVSQIQPMIRVRVTLYWDDIAYPIFTGTADDWVPDYQHNVWTYTTLTATDGMKVMATENRAGASSGGSGETSGARVVRILNSISWPVADRVIDSGVSTVQSTSLQGNALAELELVQDTELGHFYVDGRGRAVFQGRDAVSRRAASTTSQVTFGDGGFDTTGEIPYADVKLTSFDDSLINRVQITRAGGALQEVNDTASQARYLTKSFERGDLIMMSDLDALNYGKALLYQYNEAVRKIHRVEFNRPRPGVENAFWPAVLDRTTTLGDRVTVIRRPAGGGAAIEREAMVRGYEFSSNDAADLTCALVLQAADKFSYYTVEHPVYGRVGLYPVAY